MKLEIGKNVFIRRIDELTNEESKRWDSLLLTEDLRRAFMSRQYAHAVSLSGLDVVVIVITSPEEPVAFLPLQRMPGFRGRCGIFEPVGGIMTDYFGVVAKDGFSLDVIQLIDATKGYINAVFYTHLDESQQRFGLTGSECRIGLRTKLGASTAEYWSVQRQNHQEFMRNTEKKERKLIKNVGPITCDWASTQPEKDLAWLIELKKDQYTRTGKEHAPLFDAKNVALLNHLLYSNDHNCQGVLSVLRCGEQRLAAHSGLRCHDMMHVWFTVYDTSFSGYSPGRVLYKHIIDYGSTLGIKYFDNGEGDTLAKRDFANEEHFFYRGLWHASGWRGLLARGVLSAFWRMKRWLG
jgi:CelD/BcsL family acetyltransferase involved in cellulose biosynthesis